MANDKNFFTKLNEKITCRQVLNGLVLLGFMVNYMLRVNLTIAIVDMVEPNKTAVFANSTEATVDVAEETASSTRYQWDTHKQNLILGSFYWGYILTELPGGRLAEIIGPRKVWGWSMLIASIVTLATPFVASMGYMAVVSLRVIIGFMLGATFPATQPIAAKWIPPMDRTKFVSHMMASSLGAAVTLPICGYLIAWLGWESAFYVTGVVGIIWSLFWFTFFYDSPAEHPRISKIEKEFIENAIGSSSTKKKGHKVPWRQLLTSPPVWAIVITHGTNVFCYFTVVNQLPTFMKNILNYSIKENGWLSSLPYLGKYIMALSTGVLADFIRKSGKISTTATRKLFTLFAIGIPAMLMVIMVYTGEDSTWAVTIFTLAMTVNGAVTAGHLGNGLDIAPNFSGTIFGMANTLSSIGGFVSAAMVGYLTYGNPSYSQWQIVFWVLAGAYTVATIVFLVFGTGKLQDWNDLHSFEKNNFRNGLYTAVATHENGGTELEIVKTLKNMENGNSDKI